MDITSKPLSLCGFGLFGEWRGEWGTSKKNNAESNCGARTSPQAPSHGGLSEKLYAPQLKS